MDANQKFCLKWNNFQSSVTSVFDNLRQDEELVDLTLCCDGKKIKAHRMMLSACSPYFRDLLKENPCQHPVFFLKDTSYPDLAAVVEFVYKGEVNVTQSQLASFLKTAEMLQVRGLAGDEDLPPPPAQTPTQQKHQPPRPSAVPAAPSPPPAPRGRPPEQPAVKRRRRSDSPDPAPLPAEVSVKQERLDVGEPDGADGRLEASFGPAAVSGFELGQYESVPTSSAAADVAGFLSSVAEQGGSGDVMVPSSAGPSDEATPQEKAPAFRLLNKLVKNVDSLEKRQDCQPPYPPITNIRTFEEYQRVMERLQDDNFYHAMKEFLSGWCCGDLETSVKSVMRALMSNEVSGQLSLVGRNGKATFSGTPLYDAVFEVLSGTFMATRSAVNGLLTRWLSGSRDRRGTKWRRTRRGDARQDASAYLEAPRVDAGLSALVRTEDVSPSAVEIAVEEDVKFEVM